MNRQQRLALKNKQQIRCEACNRFTPVEWNLWYAWGEVHKDRDAPNPIFLCDRYLCKRSRPEGLISKEWRDRVWTERSGKWTAQNVEEDNSNKPARGRGKSQKFTSRRPDKRTDVQKQYVRKSSTHPR